jgi:hypothetical protein
MRPDYSFRRLTAGLSRDKQVMFYSDYTFGYELPPPGPPAPSPTQPAPGGEPPPVSPPQPPEGPAPVPQGFAWQPR